MTDIEWFKSIWWPYSQPNAIDRVNVIKRHCRIGRVKPPEWLMILI